ncbi:MAG: hypothetical protein N3E49_09670, partial [Bacteroidia bacterium]|nr:hypothetical protein [Bacteroidia bacterium]
FHETASPAEESWMRISIPHWCDFHDSPAYRQTKYTINFNPTLVRFSRALRFPLPHTTSEFQSHIGAIFTNPLRDCGDDCGRISIPHWCDFHALRRGRSGTTSSDFNPTLVRFSPTTDRRSLPLAANFNPTLVRFSRGIRQFFVEFQQHFNPTLVRFSLLHKAHPSLKEQQFQSHIGA